MVDTRDLKSLGGSTVRVRVPSPAPKFSQPRVGLGEFCLLVGLEQDGGPQAAKNSPVDCFLVRGRGRSLNLGVSYGAHPLTGGSRICFWGWENFVCWSDSNRTVALKNGLLRHRSAQSAARFDGKSHFFVQPRNCSAGLRVCFWGGRFLLTGRTWTGSVGWQTSEPMCSFWCA